ncbi:nucleotide-binding protein (plasmid) [Shewanella xiamenensis]|uniref:Nucleotide-binding protein n=1 Tax=Shewanella xiamenensis TaxID=332186 RepID=A0ABT6UDU5_9GAMM|nr:TIR domain-containing protein [Shewanella xiamenensis]MDI5832644.1 nucleotide-binding protein [Shewanella xiamenensis]WHF57998.1 nucleotide-binding protein [Shewanella xiamenensis]
MENQTEFVIFYSWQSDLPDNTNRNAIRSALRTACNRVEEDASIRLTLDEATRGTSGSPNIPATILEKITSCDVFVCDLTTINSSAGENCRKTPNPNVIFELGYAVAILGWPRVVMLFNTHFGVLNDLPFDIDRHRATPYLLSPADSKNKSNVSSLQSVLKDAINAVIVDNPKRPAEVNRRSPEETKKIRDIANLTEVFSSINLSTVDQMIEFLPNYLHTNIFHFWDSFQGVINSPHFHLYDAKAEDLIQKVYKGWKGCLSHDELYRDSPNPELYIFSNTIYPQMAQNIKKGLALKQQKGLAQKQQKKLDQINESRALLRRSLTELLNYIRQEYIEIDIDELSSNAWRNYVHNNRDE